MFVENVARFIAILFADWLAVPRSRMTIDGIRIFGQLFASDDNIRTGLKGVCIDIDES